MPNIGAPPGGHRCPANAVREPAARQPDDGNRPLRRRPRAAGTQPRARPNCQILPLQMPGYRRYWPIHPWFRTPPRGGARGRSGASQRPLVWPTPGARDRPRSRPVRRLPLGLEHHRKAEAATPSSRAASRTSTPAGAVPDGDRQADRHRLRARGQLPLPALGRPHRSTLCSAAHARNGGKRKFDGARATASATSRSRGRRADGQDRPATPSRRSTRSSGRPSTTPRRGGAPGKRLAGRGSPARCSPWAVRVRWTPPRGPRARGRSHRGPRRRAVRSRRRRC